MALWRITFDSYIHECGVSLHVQYHASIARGKHSLSSVYHIFVWSTSVRNHDHHGRPSFSEILDTLSVAPDSLLTVPQGCLAVTADSSRAARLGAPMMTARDLYKDLQQFYCNVYNK